jgi:hypothetical protein
MGEEEGFKSKAIGKVGEVGKKVGGGLRSRVRKAWDKAGHRKEEVSSVVYMVMADDRDRVSQWSLGTRKWITRRRRRSVSIEF